MANISDDCDLATKLLSRLCLQTVPYKLNLHIPFSSAQVCFFLKKCYYKDMYVSSLKIKLFSFYVSETDSHSLKKANQEKGVAYPA